MRSRGTRLFTVTWASAASAVLATARLSTQQSRAENKLAARAAGQRTRWSMATLELGALRLEVAILLLAARKVDERGF